MRRVPGVVPRRKWKGAAAFDRGPCSFTVGSSSSLKFSASAGSLTLTLADSIASDGAAAIGGGFTVDVTDGGSSVLHVESHFSRWEQAAERGPEAALTFRYGAAVRGISEASIRLSGGSIEGTVDGSRLASTALHGEAPSSIRLADGRDVVVEAGALRERLSELSSVVKRGFDACGVPARRRPTREIRESVHAATLRDGERETRPVEIAQVPIANGYIPGSPTGQNSGGWLDPSTPNCYNAFTNAGVAVDGCLAAAITGGFLCPPCMAYAMWGCYTAYGAALAAMDISGGSCEQVACSGGTLPNSCDTTFTCCGQSDCCPSGDTCTPLGFCCPSDAPLVCGSTYDNGYCCPANTVCGPNGDCQQCPGGQIPHDGQCCNFLCGDDCCQDPLATCDQAAGKCIYPNFGTPSPRPKRNPLDICVRTSGSVICRAYNGDNTYKNICCPPNVACCAGKCCQPGEQCGGTGDAFRCGVFLR